MSLLRLRQAGGNSEDVQGAITCCISGLQQRQGSALKSLRGQIGESLPSAVTLFAQGAAQSLWSNCLQEILAGEVSTEN